MSKSNFIKIACPNCSDDRYKSRGGYRIHDLAAALPSCLICDNNKKLIVCYACKEVCKTNYTYTTCSECKEELICDHVWKLNNNNILTCTMCDKIGKAESLSCCDHNFSVIANKYACTKCGLKANIC